jgi:hypothetical protein
MILYRPVGLQELVLFYDSSMKAFPNQSIAMDADTVS